MKADTIRNITTSAVAIIIVGYGMYSLNALVNLGKLDATALLAIYGPLIGGAAAWVFGKDNATSTARTIERAQSTQTPTQTINTAADQPVTVNAAPAVPAAAAGAGIADDQEPLGDPI